MKTNVGLAIAVLALMVFAIGSYQAPPAQTQVVSQQRVRATTWEYGRLVVSGDEASWQGGESDAPIQVFSLDGLYRRLGGTSRSNINNLLNQIGKDGWELVAADEVTWTFKRPR
jgi:hypothetical protein